jgi:hypothetical protein
MKSNRPWIRSGALLAKASARKLRRHPLIRPAKQSLVPLKETLSRRRPRCALEGSRSVAV